MLLKCPGFGKILGKIGGVFKVRSGVGRSGGGQGVGMAFVTE